MFRAVSAFHLHQKLLHTTVALFPPGLVQRPEMSTPSDQGLLGNPEKAPLNKEAVERFARVMADEMLRSLQVEMEKGPDPELVRAASGRGQKPDEEAQRRPTHPALSQSGLPILRSLDYPDAPPSTPLLPELERSRQSFARKLKGGLAKEFAPSPPPPTPKEDPGEGHFQHKVELIEHLMLSLSTEQSGGDGVGRDARVLEFAEGISWGILKCVREEFGERSDVEWLAEEMAKAIVKCSLEEARNV